jgi:CRP-like cAMP-binding protein
MAAGMAARTVPAKKNLAVLHPGERTNAEGKQVCNQILLSIPDEEFNVLRPHLKYVDMPHHLSLYEPNQKIESAYFPNCGMISLVVVMENGRTVEVGVAGKEGFSGAAAAVGLTRSTVREVVQIAGDGFQIGTSNLQSVLRNAPKLQNVMSRCAVILGMQVAQTAACNRMHSVEQRLARWLLVTQDRVDAGALPITHDFLATMLGTDRPSVSLAASGMQANGILQYTRGAVKVLNRKKLEECACECYQSIQQFNGELNLRKNLP